jgi:hypothetical protein
VEPIQVAIERYRFYIVMYPILDGASNLRQTTVRTTLPVTER